MRKVVQKAKVKAVAAHAFVMAGFVEHVGFVALAFVEVFALGHGAIQLVSAVLLVSGGAAVVHERSERRKAKLSRRE